MKKRVGKLFRWLRVIVWTLWWVAVLVLMWEIPELTPVMKNSPDAVFKTY